MIEFGKTLRQAREAKGFSVSELAERTRLVPYLVEALENEDFRRIAAAIYGRGFVKLYCAEVGLDPAVMSEAFMELYSKETASREQRPAQPAKSPVLKAAVREDEAPGSDPGDGGGEEGGAAPVRRRRPSIAEIVARVPPRAWRLALVAVATCIAIWLAVMLVGWLWRAATTPSAEGGASEAAQPAEAAPASCDKPSGRTPIEVPPLYLD